MDGGSRSFPYTDTLTPSLTAGLFGAAALQTFRLSIRSDCNTASSPEETWHLKRCFQSGPDKKAHTPSGAEKDSDGFLFTPRTRSHVQEGARSCPFPSFTFCTCASVTLLFSFTTPFFFVT